MATNDAMESTKEDSGPRRGVSRRTLLKAGGMVGAGVALGAGGYGVGQIRAQQEASTTSEADVVPFYGTHQAGIATPSQEYLNFAAFDLITDELTDVRDLLVIWSDAAARMCAGQTAGDEPDSPLLPPTDTGEALGHPAARLTLTFGFGPTFFTKDGKDRYGFAVQRPAALVDIPPMPGDALDPNRGGGDICVQACAEDQQVAFHAVRNLARLARGVAVLRWSQLGFNRTSSTSRSQQTPRNLMGFKDGTNNMKVEDTAALDAAIWAAASDGSPWMAGGSYLVARRIRMAIEAWDRASLREQENTIGRRKVSGAPLSAGDAGGEFAALDLTKRGADGKPLIPVDAHVALAHRTVVTQQILRRGYSFTDGMDPRTGQLDAGLFFICFQRDPRQQFIPLQQSLGHSDALNEYIVHTGSAIFACPPGISAGGYIGEQLFEGV